MEEVVKEETRHDYPNRRRGEKGALLCITYFLCVLLNCVG